MRRIEPSGVFQNVFFPLPTGRFRRFFSDIHCEDLRELLEVKLNKSVGAPDDWVPLEFLSLRLVHTEHTEILQL